MLLKIENGKLTKTEHPFKKSVGQYYESWKGGVYLLAQIDYSEVCLIHLQSGNRYSDPVSVSDVNNISSKEWERITSEMPFALVQ